MGSGGQGGRGGERRERKDKGEKGGEIENSNQTIGKRLGEGREEKWRIREKKGAR